MMMSTATATVIVCGWVFAGVMIAAGLVLAYRCMRAGAVEIK